MLWHYWLTESTLCYKIAYFWMVFRENNFRIHIITIIVRAKIAEETSHCASCLVLWGYYEVSLRFIHMVPVVQIAGFQIVRTLNERYECKCVQSIGVDEWISSNLIFVAFDSILFHSMVVRSVGRSRNLNVSWYVSLNDDHTRMTTTTTTTSA